MRFYQFINVPPIYYAIFSKDLDIVKKIFEFENFEPQEKFISYYE